MNLRKIIAILAAVLMFCSLIPMSVFADDGDVIFTQDFNDGTNGFHPSTIVAEGPDGSNCLMWTTAGGWNATERMVNGIQANTDYTVTFKAKGSVDGGMGITIQSGDWGAYWNGPSFDVTTEWQEFVLGFNSVNYVTADGKMLFKFQDVGVAMDLYVDDIVISEGAPELPIITNGDFEEGNIKPWTVHQQVTVEAEAAYEGNYGAHLKDNGTWGGIMDTTLTVTPGKTYELSFWIKVNKTGINLQIKDGGAGGANLASDTWYNYANHSDWTQKTYIVTPSTNAIFLNFCGAGDSTPDPDMETDTYIDSIAVRELKDSSFNGYITNGDFETGNTSGWESWQSTMISTDAAHSGSYGVNMKGDGSWGGMLNQTFDVEPHCFYELTFWYKVNQSGFNMQFYGVQSGTSYASVWATAGVWTRFTQAFMVDTDTQITINFCGGGNGISEDVYIDDIVVAEVAPPSFDGYVMNGDFEVGHAMGWNQWQSTVVSTDAAYEGEYGVHLQGNGGWSNLLDQSIMVEEGTEYVLSYWYKTNRSGFNCILSGEQTGTQYSNDWEIRGAVWIQKFILFTPVGDTNVKLRFFGSGSYAEDVYVDSVTMMPITEGNVIAVDGGVTGDCNWRLYNNGHLEIFGTGAMGDYGAVEDKAPWGSDVTSVTIGEGVTSIGKNAFYSCDLTSITIPATLTTIRGGAFEWISVTTDVHITDLESWLSIDFQGALKEYNLYLNGELVTNLVIPDGVTSIAKNAFYGFASLQSITIPDSVTAIGSYAFYNCTSLKSITIPDRVTEIGTYAFYNCTSLKSITIPDSVTTVGWYVIGNCTGLTELTVGDGVTNLLNVLQGCPNVTRLTLGGGVAEIQYYELNDLKNLMVLHLGNGITTIGERTFLNFTALTTVYIPNSVTHIGQQAFAGCTALTDVWYDGWKTESSNITIENHNTPLRNATWHYKICEHTYDNGCDSICNICSEYRSFLPHEEGYKDNYCDVYCSNCGTFLRTEHLCDNVGAVEPTCTENGNIEYWHCSDCGGTWVNKNLTISSNLTAVIVPALGHTYDHAYDITCNVCGTVREVSNIGDANGDGVVTTRDVALLQQYLAGWDVTLNEAGAYADGVGYVTVRDVALLQRYLVGWDVTLGA